MLWFLETLKTKFVFLLLFQDEDNKRGGITLQRYQELYAQFMGNESDKCAAIYLYGPIPE